MTCTDLMEIQRTGDEQCLKWIQQILVVLIEWAEVCILVCVALGGFFWVNCTKNFGKKSEKEENKKKKYNTSPY